MREAEAKLEHLTNYRVKVVEKAVNGVKDILVVADPWEGGVCGRSNCLLCKAGVDKPRCTKRNILYESFCSTYLMEGKYEVYVGESGNSAFERANQHLEGYRTEKSDNHMWSHARDAHGGRKDLHFKFVVIKTFQLALSRQVAEAAGTRRRGVSNILNSKGVFNRCAIPELSPTTTGYGRRRRPSLGVNLQRFQKEEKQTPSRPDGDQKTSRRMVQG